MQASIFSGDSSLRSPYLDILMGFLQIYLIFVFTECRVVRACGSIFKRYDPKEYEHSRRFEEASSIFHLSIANTADHCTTVCQSMLVTVVVEKAIGYILILILFVMVP